MPLGIGPWELLIILFIVLLVFGAKRVPEMGRSLGKGMREFKEGISNPFDDDEPQVRELERSTQASAEPTKSESATAKSTL